MPTDRVLVEIVTAANMTGIKQAQAGFLGMSNALSAAIVGLGLAVIAGKSAIENTNAQDAMRELNDALDLSTLRGMDLEDTQKQITLALTGSSKALKILGITTDEYSAIMKDKTLTAEQKHHALLVLIESKTKDGRKAQTDLTQSTQALNKDWQDITTKVGPPLLALFTFIVGKADELVKALSDLGNNKDWNKAISTGLGWIQDQLIGVVAAFRDIVNFVQWLI